MMSQNRQSSKVRLDAQHDYVVNVSAELEIEKLHANIAAVHENIAALHAESSVLHARVREMCDRFGP